MGALSALALRSPQVEASTANSCTDPPRRPRRHWPRKSGGPPSRCLIVRRRPQPIKGAYGVGSADGLRPPLTASGRESPMIWQLCGSGGKWRGSMRPLPSRSPAALLYVAMSQDPQGDTTSQIKRPLVVLAPASFLIGVLITIPALHRPITTTKAGVIPTVTVTPTRTGVSPSPSPSQSPGPGPTATVTVTPQAGVNVVMPSSISVQVAGGGGDSSAWWAAGGSFLAGIGALGMVPIAIAGVRRKKEPDRTGRTLPRRRASKRQRTGPEIS
jgi:hypothetical protein